MIKSPIPRFGLALALCAFMGAGLSQANAQDTRLARGDAVVTGFSGVKPLDTPAPAGADPLDTFFIDLQGPSAQILSLSALGYGPQGQLTPAPAKRQITAGQVGQVFGTTLDDGQGQPVPNIYLGATSAYGIQIVGPDTDGDGQPNRLKTGAPGAQFMAGQFGPAPGTPGTIWRVDGMTGAVAPFAALPGNSGPGVGDVVFDKRTQQIFASDLDNGKIYRIAPDGTVVDSFDHGVSGRPAKALPPVADNGQVMDITSPSFDSQNPATWGYTQKARMVWGLAIHNDRLFYAVAGGRQVWSIGINIDGTFANDPRWELDAEALSGDGPITNIVFDGQGRMLLAQRGAPRGAYDYSAFAEPGKSSVVRYHLETPDDPATPSVWAPDADEYAIGMRPEFRNADGGIALGYRHDPETGELVPGSCNATLWSTGSRLRSSVNPDTVDDGSGEADVHGLQGNDASLVRPQNVPPAQAYYVDYDGLFGDAAKSGHMGDVAVWQPCSGGFEIRGDLPPGFYPPGGIIVIDWPHPHGHPTNLRLRKRAIRQCVRWGAGWACRFAISIRNTGPNPYFGPLQITDHMPGLPPGSLVGFSPMPPWGCGGGGGNFTCARGPVFLPVGGSRHLFVTVWVPNAAVRPGHCRIRNVAKITFAPGGSVWNTNPGDDTDSATAVIPARQCQQRTNLVIRKISQGCAVTGHDVATCNYRVTVINAGPGVYNDTIRVVDQPLAGTTATFAAAPWNCVAAGPGYTCTHPPVNLASGASVSFNARVRVPLDVARQHNCSIRNDARITFAPGGSPQNTNAGDDASFAIGTIPASFCAPPPVPIIQHSCPPGYRYVDGACQRPPRVRPPERHCPQGTVRRGDRCVTIEHVCPPNTVGRWPHCRQKPVVDSCPQGTVRRHGRCVTIHRECPRGMIGRWPHCHRRPVVRPCPQGTVRKGHRCVPIVRHVCPRGTVGTWPNCRQIHRTPPPRTHRPLVRVPHATLRHGHGQGSALR